MSKLIAMTLKQFNNQGCIRCGSDFEHSTKIETYKVADENNNEVKLDENIYNLATCLECGKQFIISKFEINPKNKIYVNIAGIEYLLENYNEEINNKFKPSKR